ncbi:MAG TPA: MFS transporter, partial [Gemmatimonadaceae bacterium]|nr:MFS transporter [Gemmatimonadaceae bacterium]
MTIACLGMLAFGIVLTTLGASLPTVIARFGIDKSQAGALFLLLSFGILAGSLVFGPVVDRRGYKGLLIFALAGIGAGLELIAFAPSLGVLRMGVVLIGFAGGIVNGATNALVADISTESRGAGLSLLGVFFGIGAAGVPFALSQLAGRYSHAAIVAATGALMVLPVGLTLLSQFPAAKQEYGTPLADVAQLLRDPVLLTFGFMLFLQSGMEITVGGWTSTFFAEELGVAADRALVYLSLYWVGMMLARLALGTLLRRVRPVPALLTCLGVALCGASLLLLTRSVTVAAAGVFLLGAGFAATFPVVLGFVGDRYARLSGTAFSVAIVMALVGGMLLPWTTGVLGATYGLRGSFLIVPACLVVSATLLAVVAPRAARTAATT